MQKHAELSESDAESPRHFSLGMKNDPMEKEPMMPVSENVNQSRERESEMTFDPVLMNKRLNSSNVAMDNFDLGLINDSSGEMVWLVVVSKLMALTLLMYTFICSLEMLSSSFRLVGGRTANQVISQSELLKNPIVGLMIGVLVTVLLQSSSTSTSVVVTMVASDLIKVRDAIPLVMGANVGTSVTNTIVSLMQASDRKEFGRAFAAATVHDMFNWLTVIVLMPIELLTGYLENSTRVLINWLQLEKSNVTHLEAPHQNSFLKKITKPIVSSIVSLNKKSLEEVHVNSSDSQDVHILMPCCKDLPIEKQNTTACLKSCTSLFNRLELSDGFAGILLLVMSLVCLCTCLILVVKLLHSMLKGRIAFIIKTYINADYKFPFSLLIGYVAILLGCFMTILVQSSSIFTSALTPLAGLGVISLERVYPLTLGSNIGTTTTGLLAAMASDPKTLHSSMQLALCHLLFNITGILIFYPLPITRLPIPLAKALGRTTAKYRWFSIFYLLFMFFIGPLFIFLLSLGGPIVFTFFAVPLVLFLLMLIAINFLQKRYIHLLPSTLHDWQFLPLWLHSLDPYDALLQKLAERCFFVACCVQPDSAHDLHVMNAISAQDRNASRLQILDPAKDESVCDSQLLTAYDNVMFVTWPGQTNENISASQVESIAAERASTSSLLHFYVHSNTNSPK